MTDALSAKPIQAALSSAASFAVGGIVPLIVSILLPEKSLLISVALVSLFCLALLGGVAAKVGGAPVLKGAWRVMFWGALAMGVTTAVGSLVGTKV